jgi:hypothetical protein
MELQCSDHGPCLADIVTNAALSAWILRPDAITQRGWSQTAIWEASALAASATRKKRRSVIGPVSFRSRSLAHC